MKIVSWNVNGIAACRRKGLLKFLSDTKPDIACFQEVKTKCALSVPGYRQYWNNAERPGYAGTLVLTRREPITCKFGMGIDELDTEGRLITLEYKDYYVLNVYVPSLNTYSEPSRLEYRNKWDAAFREYISSLPKPVIVAGDCNVTRSYIDSYPENQRNNPDTPLFEPEIRANFEQLLSCGFVDVFRALYPEKEGAYTWWGPKNNSRLENKGSRLDYFLVSGELFSSVLGIKFHVDTHGSDHCPVSMTIAPTAVKHKISTDILAEMWRSIDWTAMREELLKKQKAITRAAFYRNWLQVEILQQELVCSWAARALAVQAVVDANSEVGVDGIRWKTDEQKAEAALSLTDRNYRPRPYRHTEIITQDKLGNEKLLVIHVPVVRDKAMLTLYAYALDPVSEATADPRSFFARKGRSMLDLHAYLFRDLSGPDAPEWIIKIDVLTFYRTIVHTWLLMNIHMDKKILRKFLKAGVVMKGDLFPTDEGISMGISLSPILANMMLDGLQSYIYDRLFPKGQVDYRNGALVRFADDILIVARSKTYAELIMQIVTEFLSERGLRINYEKSYIVNVNQGFDFLSRHYQKRNGILYATPSDSAIIKLEHELESLIMNFRGTQRALINRLNKKLSGVATYHRVTDAYMDFRHIDAVVIGLLIKLYTKKYAHWKPKTVLRRFFVQDGSHYIFVLPEDPSCRVRRLAPLEIASHKPCQLKFNPYLDRAYYEWLQGRRGMQKATGKYHAIWTRQNGRCAYCEQSMLPDQEVELVEIVLGQGRHISNLQYIHRQCAYDVRSRIAEPKEHINLFSILDGVMSDTPPDKSPYLELKDYFRLCKKSPISLTFGKIETIIGEELSWEAHMYKSFWYDDEPGTSSPMWQAEGYPGHAVTPSERDYCICDCWRSQGYEIKALHLEKKYIVFRRVENGTSGIQLPKVLTDRRLPDTLVFKFDQMVRQFIKENGL